MSETKISAGKVFALGRIWLKDLFNLEEDAAREKDTIEEIKKGVVFGGANLWILIFAIMVCSVGLNVNSTAVIIGAMLISPLMGPIMGVGLGIGINDFQLITKALKNLLVAVVISVLTSAIYFLLSPLDDAQSELLARTAPTLWDVFIAFFGGLAGIVAGSRKEKSNAIPGVAIATALMPPLCTAGYALSTGSLNFFLGAMYLFFINSVFISLSTFIIVRFLGFRLKVFEEPAREKKVKRYIAVLALITILPSIYTAFRVVQKSVFDRNANQYIANELNFDNTQIISKKVVFSDELKKIEVTLFGAPIADDRIDEAKGRTQIYGLENTEITVHQGFREKTLDHTDLEKMNQELKSGIIEDLYNKNLEMLNSKDEKISFLEGEIVRLQSESTSPKNLAAEAKAIHPNLLAFSLTNAFVASTDSLSIDTVHIALTNFSTKPTKKEVAKLENWLKVRAGLSSLKIIVETEK